ncbi:MAG: hypothetical protein JRI55_02555 [Deltaproteobacteria bacterium]|jgi:hypothetical protein|nr:hypothetical protein [Deltaproteobacteria bacterium]
MRWSIRDNLHPLTLLLGFVLLAAGCNVIPITVPTPKAQDDSGVSWQSDAAPAPDSGAGDVPYVPPDISIGTYDTSPPAGDAGGGLVDGFGEGPVGDGLLPIEAGPADGLVPTEGGPMDDGDVAADDGDVAADAGAATDATAEDL